jgi:hypothetical protein
MDELDTAFMAGFDGPDTTVEAVAPAADASPSPVTTSPVQSEPKADDAPAAGEPKPEPSKDKTFTQAELDRIVTERLAREKATNEKQLKSHPVLSYVERVAQQNGMTVDAVLAAWQQQEIERVAEQNGITPDAAKRLVEAETKVKTLEVELQDTRTAAQKQADEDKEFLAFVEAFPGVDGKTIPTEVWDARATGKTLTEAYKAHTEKAALSAKDKELQTLRDEIAGLKQKMDAIGRNPIGNGVGAHGAGPLAPEDPFLIGFNSL